MKRLLIILAGVLAIWANGASAAIFVTWGGAAPVAPGVWDWTYSITLQTDQTMAVGDFATVYDFRIAGFDASFNPTLGKGGTVLDRTFDIITGPPVGTGTIPGPVPGFDDATISDVSVKLTGGGDIPGTPAAGPRLIGTLHILANTDKFELSDYVSQAQFGGAPTRITNKVEVPIAIPEPGSLTLMMVGLLAAGGLAFRRRQM